MKVQDTTTTTPVNDPAEGSETATTETETEPVVKDTAEKVAEEPKKELAGKDDAPKQSEGSLAEKMQGKLDEQVEKYRLESQIGNKTIAKPNDVQDQDSVKTIEAGEAKEIDDAGKELDAAMARGKKAIVTAGRKAAGKSVETSSVDEGVATVGMVTDLGGRAWDLAHGAANGGKELASKGALGVGVLGVGATAVGVYTGIGGAHQDAHAFNEKEGYQNGYATGYASGLYGEHQYERHNVVKRSDNSKKQTYDRAYNAGVRRGHADATRQSDERKLEQQMAIESEMEKNGELHHAGDANVAGAYVKRAGAWYSEMLP